MFLYNTILRTLVLFCLKTSSPSLITVTNQMGDKALFVFNNKYFVIIFKVRIWFGAGEMPSDTEEALLLWINRAVLAIKDYIQNNNSREHKLVS